MESATISDPSASPYRVYRLEGLPPEAIYVPNFITEYEEEYLLKRVAESPQPKWKTQNTGRRVQYLGGTLSKNNVLIPESLPEWITHFPALIERIRSVVAELEDRHVPNLPEKQDSKSREEKLKAWTPNHVLINEYQAGQGIAPHEDGPAYLPIVATVSLGSPQTLEIFQYLAESDPSPPLTGSSRSDVFGSGCGRPIATTPMGCIYLEPRSLFISRKAIYETFLHGISPVEEDVFELDGGEIGNRDEGETRIKVKLAGVEVSNSDHLNPATKERLREAIKAGEKEVRIKRDKRVSLTFRRVEKVLQGGLGVGVLGRGTAGARR
ncbi:hypothetical protein FFLO_06194 [Filobasidium floriforme]|uniref:Fe2OG dioxygenase domain-containing protein n=1 Tax=Filobasidium floriforme TaxID=5210 RepID=A0A8K0JH67_9TREE|nr:hypothetical protein FFLO_06194 [Filobasidium floriforme]